MAQPPGARVKSLVAARGNRYIAPDDTGAKDGTMTGHRISLLGLAALMGLGLAACGDRGGVGKLLTEGAEIPAGGSAPVPDDVDLENTRPTILGGRMEVPPDPQRMDGMSPERRRQAAASGQGGVLGLGGLLGGGGNPDSIVKVNRYIWRASLETLDFLPVESADPFSGIITTGWGRAPGGGQEYRATIFVQDPALDARSLKVALFTRRGAVSEDTQRQVEDAILTRARQIRLADNRL